MNIYLAEHIHLGEHIHGYIGEYNLAEHIYK